MTRNQSPDAKAPTARRRTTQRDHRTALVLFTSAAELRAAETAENPAEFRRHVRSVRRELVEAAGPVRISTAVTILDLSEKTVRDWLKAGILLPARSAETTRAVLDPERLDQVAAVLESLRAAGHKHGLTDAVWHRLQDDALRASDQFSEAVDEMRSGSGSEWAQRPDGSWGPIE
jgi:MerR HTH family regulatory protein